MAVQIIWQPDPSGPSALWLVEGGQPSHRLFAVPPNQMGTAQPLVQRWADQADSVPEFRLLATFGEAGAAQNAAPPPRGECHLSHLAMSSPTTRLTICRGDTGPVPRHRHREAHH